MRLYMAELGIFLSRDFLPYPNKYRAWSNNPVGQVDRDGLASINVNVSQGTSAGYVYVVKNETLSKQTGVPHEYTGSTIREVETRLQDSGHPVSEFLNHPDTEVYAREVMINKDASNLTPEELKTEKLRAVQSVETDIARRVERTVEPEGINKTRGLRTPTNAAKHIGNLEASVGIERLIFRGGKVVKTGIAVLDFSGLLLSATADEIEKHRLSHVVYGINKWRDNCGNVFEIKYDQYTLPPILGGFEWSKSNFRKVYIDGPKKGQVESISRDEFEYFERDSERRTKEGLKKESQYWPGLTEPTFNVKV